MGFWASLFGKKPSKVWRIAGDGLFEAEVVGESRYQPALERLTGGKTEDGHEVDCVARLLPEPRNAHDANAVMVTIEGELVGYLPRARAKAMAVRLRRGGYGSAQVDAVIVGGWSKRGGKKPEGHFGVKLDIPEEPLPF